MYVSKTEVEGACANPKRQHSSSVAYNTEAHVKQILGARALKRFLPIGSWLRNFGVTRVVLAGGAMLHPEPKDLDLFLPPEWVPEANRKVLVNDGKMEEYCIDGVKVQVCVVDGTTVEGHGDPTKLISGFDFAHCQVGALLEFYPTARKFKIDVPNPHWAVVDTYFTPAWQAAMMTQGTTYNAASGISIMPRAKWRENSLARLPEVAKKFNLDRGEVRALVNQILGAMEADRAKPPEFDSLFPV